MMVFYYLQYIGRIFYANRAVGVISGVPINQIVGKTSKELEEGHLREKVQRSYIGSLFTTR